MSLSPDVKFKFVSSAVDESFFQVLQFSGTEKLGGLFQFSIQLHSESTQLTVGDLLNSDCELELDVYGESRTIHGVLSDFEYLSPVDNGHLFRAVLVPRLWRLSQITTNEVYLEQDLTETLEQVLTEAGLDSSHYDLSMLSGYRKWDYRCQFGESHYNFLKRITEREGVYFYFDHTDGTDKVVFCDSQNQHPETVADSTYSSLTGQSLVKDEPIIYQIKQAHQRIAKTVTLKDYNNDQPSANITSTQTVDPQGFGELFIYCENLQDTDEAESLAEIRMEELKVHKEQFFISSLDIRMNPGHSFDLTEHPFDELNNEYYPLEIEHWGYSPGLQYLHQKSELPYNNSIKAIKSDIQFRPALETEKPRFYGVLNAIIDSEGVGQYSHLDERGRYKVTLPFDRVVAERGEAQASWWIPMAQPNAGENSGMHFPLLKGAEVLLSFIGGDPDRPIITGAVPNAAKPSVVREDNHTVNKIKTASNNIIELEDEQDNERIKLFSPNSNSYFHLGAANPVNANGLMMITSGGYYQEIGGGYQISLLTTPNLSSALHTLPQDHDNDSETENIDVAQTSGVTGSSTSTSLLDGTDSALDLIDETKMHVFQKADDTGKLGAEINPTEERSGDYFIHREFGEKYFWNDGNTHTFGGSKDFGYGNGYEINYIDEGLWDGDFPEDRSFTDAQMDAMIIGKTIGHTYDYQKGKNEAVHVGDVDEYHEGFAKSVHNGSSNERTYGGAATAGEAIAAKLEGAVHATDIAGKLSGLSIDASVQIVKAEIDFSALKLDFSGALKTIEHCEGEFDQKARIKAEITSPIINLNAAPLVTPPPATPTMGDKFTAWAKGFTENQGIDVSTPAPVQLSLEPTGATLKGDPAVSKLELKAASSTLTGASTNVKGATTKVEGTTALNLEGASTTLKGTGTLTMEGATASLKGTGTLNIEGATLNIQGKATAVVKASGATQIQGSILQLG